MDCAGHSGLYLWNPRDKTTRCLNMVLVSMDISRGNILGTLNVNINTLHRAGGHTTFHDYQPWLVPHPPCSAKYSSSSPGWSCIVMKYLKLLSLGFSSEEHFSEQTARIWPHAASLSAHAGGVAGWPLQVYSASRCSIHQGFWPVSDWVWTWQKIPYGGESVDWACLDPRSTLFTSCTFC